MADTPNETSETNETNETNAERVERMEAAARELAEGIVADLSTILARVRQLETGDPATAGKFLCDAVGNLALDELPELANVPTDKAEIITAFVARTLFGPSATDAESVADAEVAFLIGRVAFAGDYPARDFLLAAALAAHRARQRR